KVEDWEVNVRTQYLDELLRLDGRGSFIETDACGVCTKGIGVFRCKICIGGGLRCSTCIVSEHMRMPLHPILKWNGSFFEKTALSALGLRIQLGHDIGTCGHPEPGPCNFLVVDLTGFHRVSINFCACKRNGVVTERYVQLLRTQWFPATFDSPATAFTFDLLDFFHQLTHQAKTNAYDFLCTIQQRTDSTGVEKEIHRYNEFACVVRIWRHLILIKRAGRGHDPSGIEAALAGSCVITCLACPIPGVNLPEGWDSMSVLIIWLFALFLSVDANFKLRLKARGISFFQLGSGWSYSVEDDDYNEVTDSFGEQTEENNCESQHSAIIKANTRNAKGYLASGIAGLVCGRHTLVRPSAFGDLKKGERYCSIDYLLLATLIGAGVKLVFLTYDIACQWVKNFPSRVKKFPARLRRSVKGITLRTAVPKAHIEAHGPSCHSKHSLNTQPYVGRTYGEGVEQQWSHINSVATSTREMGPGARKEVLNDHWNWWNWRKCILFGPHFKKNLEHAISMHEKHHDLFIEFSSTFPKKVVEEWSAMVDTWVADQTKPDPYAEPVVETTMNDIRLQLAKEDDADKARSRTVPHELSPSAFLFNGLQLEEQQRAIRHQVSASSHRTPTQQAELQETRNTLRNRIQIWQTVQDVHMPFVPALRHQNSTASADLSEPITADNPPSASILADNIPLFLPSSLPNNAAGSCESLRKMEYRLRYAQCDDALADIRRLRRVLKNVTYFKAKNITGTGGKANTRARTLYNRFQGRVTKAVEKYRDGRAALEKLDAGGAWANRFQVLNSGDVRGPGMEDGNSFGHFEQSWIWLVPPQQGEPRVDDDTAERYGESVRVEWSKSKARVMRWGEECHLIVEEMRRVLVSLESKAVEWDTRRSSRVAQSADVQDGLAAYAAKQAYHLRELRLRFASLWLPVLHDNESKLSNTVVGCEVDSYTKSVIVALKDLFNFVPPKEMTTDTTKDITKDDEPSSESDNELDNEEELDLD
ncbi:hypothetical protein SCHPADRAFT_840402, partial [Schizopora paradoxa]